jgi:hypothetical protein
MNAAEYPAMITSILSYFVRILSSIALSMYLHVKDQKRGAFAASLKQLFARKNGGKIFLDMGTGMEVTLVLCTAMNTMELPSDSPVSLFSKFVLEIAEDVFRICKIRRDLKTGKSRDVQVLVEKLSRVLKRFTALGSEIYAVTSLEYISEDPKTPFRIDLINWNDITPLDLRDPVQVKRAAPMSSGEQGVFLYTRNSKQFQMLPDFLIYRKCPQCKKRHFYIADSMKLSDTHVKEGVSIRMNAVSDGENCAPVTWPNYKRQL